MGCVCSSEPQARAAVAAAAPRRGNGVTIQVQHRHPAPPPALALPPPPAPALALPPPPVALPLAALLPPVVLVPTAVAGYQANAAAARAITVQMVGAGNPAGRVVVTQQLARTGTALYSDGFKPCIAVVVFCANANDTVLFHNMFGFADRVLDIALAAAVAPRELVVISRNLSTGNRHFRLTQMAAGLPLVTAQHPNLPILWHTVPIGDFQYGVMVDGNTRTISVFVQP